MVLVFPSPVSITASSIALCIIAVIVVGLRFWSRHVQRAELMLDDWILLPALVLTIGVGASAVVGEREGGLGHHIAPDADFVVAAQIEWALQLMQIPQLGMVKLGFLLFFRRIFVIGKTQGRFNVATLIMMALVIAWTTAFFLGVLFACGTDFSAWWEGTSCPQISFEKGFIISDFVMDVIILTLPLPMIWRLHMTTWRKVGVTAIFGLGALSVAASIIRVATFYQIQEVRESVDSEIQIGVWLITEVVFWSAIESEIAMIAVCLPVIPSLFRKIPLQSLVRSLRSLSSKPDSSHNSRGSRTLVGSERNFSKLEGEESMTSQAHIVSEAFEPSTVESYAMKDLTGKSQHGSLHDGEITVNNTITQHSDNMV